MKKKLIIIICLIIVILLIIVLYNVINGNKRTIPKDGVTKTSCNYTEENYDGSIVVGINKDKIIENGIIEMIYNNENDAKAEYSDLQKDLQVGKYKNVILNDKKVIILIDKKSKVLDTIGHSEQDFKKYSETHNYICK